MSDPLPLPDVIAARLGGTKVLGLAVKSDADLLRLVENGLPLRVLDGLLRIGFSAGEIDALIISRASRRYRLRKKRRLTIDESDRVIRIVRIFLLAVDCFGDSEKALRWLRRPTSLLDGRAPLSMARTETGVRIVETAISKINWGVPL